MPIDPNTLASIPLEELLSAELMQSAMAKMSEVADFDTAFKTQLAQRRMQRMVAESGMTEAQGWERYRASTAPRLSGAEQLQRDNNDAGIVAGRGVIPEMADNRTPGDYVEMLGRVPDAIEEQNRDVAQALAEQRIAAAEDAEAAARGGYSEDQLAVRHAENLPPVGLSARPHTDAPSVGSGGKKRIRPGETVGGHELWADRAPAADAMEARFGRLDDLRLREGAPTLYRAMAGTHTDPNDFIGQLAGQLALQRRRAMGPDDPSLRAIAEGTIDMEDLAAYPPGPML